MEDKEIEELQDPENWDWENAQSMRVPPDQRRSVVSVSLRRDQSRLIAEAADRAGERASEYIRNAALQRVSGQSLKVSLTLDPDVLVAQASRMNAKRRRRSARARAAGSFT